MCENAQNRSLNVNNKLGEMNIGYNKSKQTYEFHKRIDYQSYTATFKTLNEAIDYRDNIFTPETFKFNKKCGKLNEKYISRNKNSFAFKRIIKGKSHRKYFKTLNEAIDYRDNIFTHDMCV